MPGVAVHTHSDPMIGVDLHDEAAPPGTPAPCVPHVVAGLLCTPPWGLKTGKPNPKVWATGGMVVSQGSDMGVFIPHIPVPAAPANLLAPLMNATSGSKSNFGVHKNRAPQGALAAASGGTVGLNLNCGGSASPPMLSGAVLALFQTVKQGFTLGDVLAGALRAAADAFVQHRLNQFFQNGWGADFVTVLKDRVIGAIAPRATSLAVRLAPLGTRAAGAIVRELLEFVGIGSTREALKVGSSIALGSPIGYSPPWSEGAKIGGYEDQIQNTVLDSLDRLFEDPTIEEFPNAAELGPWPGL
jgi:hypothetical protein